MSQAPILMDLSHLWKSLYSQLEKKVTPQFFNQFFAELQCIELQNDTLLLHHADERILKHLKKRYTQLIQSEAENILHKDIQVQFVQNTSNINHHSTKNIKHSNNLPPHEGKGPNTSIIQTDVQYLNKQYTFERYIQGPSNEHAYLAALNIAQNPGTYHNPFYIYGNVGVGKTHLMSAIGNYIQQHRDWLQVYYVPSSIFQDDLCLALEKKSLNAFKKKYQNLDVLLLDDIQFITKNARFTQEQIFHLFNFLYQANKQIVICSDCPPQKLTNLQDRLVSRFQSGLLMEIKPPNFETRLRIIEAKQKEVKLNLSNEVIDYIAQHFPSQIRLLEAALNKLHFYSNISNEALHLNTVIEYLADLTQETKNHEISNQLVAEIVSRYYNISINDLKGKDRSKNITLARHVGMFLCKSLIKKTSLQEIATAFGRKEHATVINAEKKIHSLLKMKPDFKEEVNQIQNSILKKT